MLPRYVTVMGLPTRIISIRVTWKSVHPWDRDTRDECYFRHIDIEDSYFDRFFGRVWKLKLRHHAVAKKLGNFITGRESNKGVMTVRKYSFILGNSSHKSIWGLYVLAKYGNFVLNIKILKKLLRHFWMGIKKSNWFLKKKVICQNSSQTGLTLAVIWVLFARK